MFDWLGLLDSNGIEYRVTGREQVSITCPFCLDDPSMHMSINIEGLGWRCWRQPAEHFGKNPNRLIAALLNIDRAQAAEITGSNTFVPSNFLERTLKALRPPPPPQPKPLTLPDEFQPLSPSVLCRPYVNYLAKRGFSLDEIYAFHKYGIYYCKHGAYHGRIIFTVNMNKQLMTWTGRTVSTTNDLRYLTLSPSIEKAEREGTNPALGAITDYVLWHDHLKRADADTLILCEGPFDALKVRRLGRKEGIVATCLFTSRATPQQADLLMEVFPRFKRRYLILDRNTLPLATRVLQNFDYNRVKLLTLPDGVKDPGELSSPQQLKAILGR